MPTASAIINKLGVALTKAKAYNRLVYKRVIVTTGGDPLIGRGSTTDITDTLLNPPPLYIRLSKNTDGGDNDYPEMLLSGDGSNAQVGNSYSMLVSPAALSRQELANPNLMVVFKDAMGSEEIFRVSYVEPVSFQGTDVTMTVYIKSIQRPAGGL